VPSLGSGQPGVLRASAGARRLALWVVETNRDARAFYEREGMTWDGARQRHPVSPDESLVEVRYRLELPRPPA
jgi:hypothetical protein